MVSVRDCTVDDVLSVIAHASDASTRDIQAFGATTDRILSVFEASAAAKTIASTDGYPILVFGGAPQAGEPGVWITWMFYTDEFYPNHNDIDAEIAKVLEEVPPANGCKVLRLYSILSMPKSEEWMKQFGFERVGQAGPVVVLERRY